MECLIKKDIFETFYLYEIGLSGLPALIFAGQIIIHWLAHPVALIFHIQPVSKSNLKWYFIWNNNQKPQLL